MKWFKHETDDRNKITSKLIRSKFKAEGYGIYMALIEVIGEYVEADNVDEWGHVHPLHTVETLAEECSTTPERLKEFLEFCNEKNIFIKHDERLFSDLILERLDTFFSRSKSNFKPTSKSVRSNDAYRREEKRREEKRIDNNENPKKEEIKSSSELSVKEILKLDERQSPQVTQEFQSQALEIIKALGVNPDRKSAYFKAVKDNDRSMILKAYSFAVDHPDSTAKDKMFFWKLNQLKANAST